MSRKKYMAIHTFHSDEMKKLFGEVYIKVRKRILNGGMVIFLTNANARALGLVMMIFFFSSGNLKLKKMC